MKSLSIAHKRSSLGNPHLASNKLARNSIGCDIRPFLLIVVEEAEFADLV
ncbi:hypothetical protein M3Y14_32990 (plasmid) [Bacillus thuringiensis]|nr:hypothetical protein [Bacillus thuringiensis]UYX55840.1 hypothetical protein M3Y14_32990 [Bacillus thuringiensis]